MKVIFNKQYDNSDKHPLMPSDYPFVVYEVEDDFNEDELILLGYTVHSLVQFELYKESFDLTLYNVAISPSADERIRAKLAIIKSICDEEIFNLKASMIKQGVSSPYNGMVIKYLRDLMLYLEVQAMDEAYSEIDRLIAENLPENLAPFLTNTVLTSFKNELIARIALI